MPQKPAIRDVRSLWLRSIAFVVGFCMMSVELVAGRLVAPYLGSSLYTWTAVLAAVLAAIAAGSYIGGRLAGTRGVKSGIGFWLAAGAALLLVCVFFVTQAIGPWLQASDLPIAILTSAFALGVFFPPTLALAVLMPLLVKRDVAAVEDSGFRFGGLAAWNAAGSILGTYVAGFFFIAYLNTDHVMLAVSAVLIVAAALDPLMKERSQQL